MEKFKRGTIKLLHPPYTLADFHLFMTFLWIFLFIPTLLWWRESVLWVAFISLWANAFTHAGAFSAATGADKIEQVLAQEVSNDNES